MTAVVQLNPFLRATSGYRMRDMFPTPADGTCSCGCGKPRPRGCSRWAHWKCTETALQLFDIRQGRPAAVRRALMERDAGVCSGCGTVCRMMTSEPEMWPWPKWAPVCYPGRCPDVVSSLPHRPQWHDVVPWQAHHLVAVSEGGGGCDLDGYVILCNPCHGKETGALRRRLNGSEPLPLRDLDIQLGLWRGEEAPSSAQKRPKSSTCATGGTA